MHKHNNNASSKLTKYMKRLILVRNLFEQIMELHTPPITDILMYSHE